MKVGLQSWGSEGDLRPFLALARGLRARGDDVELFFTSITPTSLTFGDDIPVTFIGPPPDPLDAALGEWVRMGDDASQAMFFQDRIFRKRQPAMMEASMELARRNDLLIGHNLLHSLRCAAERLGKPEVSVSLGHNLVPSMWEFPTASSTPSAGVNLHRLQQFANRHHLSFVNETRHQLGLPDWHDVITQAWSSPLLNLVAVASAFCGRQRDGVHAVCGPLRLFEQQENESPVRECGATGESIPIGFSFGSHMPREANQARAVLETVSEALRLEGRRGILQIPNSLPEASLSADHVRLVRTCNHERLFRSCGAVIHHGGAGTSHTVCAAGIPSIVVPHVGDQFFWAAQLSWSGLAPAPLPRRCLSISALRRAIRSALDSETMQARAAQMRRQMLNEDGVATAIALIERTILDRPRSANT